MFNVLNSTHKTLKLSIQIFLVNKKGMSYLRVFEDKVYKMKNTRLLIIIKAHAEISSKVVT